MNKKQYLDLIDGINETLDSIKEALSRDFATFGEEFDIDEWESCSDYENIAYEIGYYNGLRWIKAQLCDPLNAQDETIKSMMDGRNNEQ